MSKRDSVWPAVMRGVAGGALLGGGIGIGAYSSAVWLFLAVILMVAGAGLLGSAASVRRPRADGTPVTVVVSALDRSVAVRQDVQPTIVTGTVLPQGDAPYQAQFLADLGVSDADRLLGRGRAGLPASVVPGPGAKPVFGFSGRLPLRAAVCVVTAVAVMWGVAVVPGEAWRFGGPTSSSGLFGGPADRFREAVEYIRTERPGEAAKVMRIHVDEKWMNVDTYLGNGRTAGHHRNTGQGWNETFGKGDALKDSRKAFDLAKLDGFDASAVLAAATAQVPEEYRGRLTGVTAALEDMTTDDDDGEGSALLVTATFGESRDQIVVEAQPDGTVAPWWPATDIPRSLEAVKGLLTAQKARLDAPVLTEVGITGYRSGRGPVSRSWWPGVGAVISGYPRPALTGRFARTAADPGRPMNVRHKTFRFTDLDAGVLNRIIDDAKHRFGVEPVDEEQLRLAIGTQDRHDDPFEDRLVVTIRYSDTGKAETYDLKGAYLGRSEFLS